MGKEMADGITIRKKIIDIFSQNLFFRTGGCTILVRPETFNWTEEIKTKNF